MKSTLVDSGPLIALFDRDDKHHRRIKKFFKANPLRLVTTWPVVTEVCALLPRASAWDFLEWVRRGAVAIVDLSTNDTTDLLTLLRKYDDLPMDLADASLVVTAVRQGMETIVSLDSDFAVYRLPGKRTFKNLLS